MGMRLLKCEYCGGELEVNSDLSVGKCRFCDSTMIIPKHLDRKENLYNSAVHYRQRSEFDIAISKYEEILDDDFSDGSAHWGLVLSKYGVEYVCDPHTHERIPTCHRTQAESILTDSDYLAAIEYSDAQAQQVIEKEARRINDIQAKIIEISQKETPYDIFICYKESDDSGNRTEDSILAQELYYELQKKGYKVFFARKTLESKLGTEYEPVIYAALNSAKVMIVLGTKREHFESPWVQNEWRRFIKMSKNSDKIIIPAYRYITAYDLPDALSIFQSQDMSKIGFMQDLMDGIEKYIRNDATDAYHISHESYGGSSLERLLQNSQTYLKLENYDSAKEVYTSITKDYPEDYRGWWGLIVCETRHFTDIKLDQDTLKLWFGYAKKLAPADEFLEIEKTYVEYIRKVSLLEAKEDINAVYYKIGHYNQEINSLEETITLTNQQLNERTEEYREQASQHEQIIRDGEKNLKKVNRLPFIWMMKKAIGVILFLYGLKQLSTNLLWGILYILIGWIIAFSSDGLAVIRNKITNQDDALANEKYAQTRHQEQYNQNMEKYHQTITSCQENIAMFQDKISHCENYIALGQEKISTLFFAKRCKEFEVQQDYDQAIEDYRNAAFEEDNQDSEDKEIMTCPQCHKEVHINDHMRMLGHCYCSNCGVKIELEKDKK